MWKATFHCSLQEFFELRYSHGEHLFKFFVSYLTSCPANIVISGLFYQRYQEGSTEAITYAGPGPALIGSQNVSGCDFVQT